MCVYVHMFCICVCVMCSCMFVTYFGHAMRKEGDCLEKELVQGTTPGARKQGKPTMWWMDNMEQWTGMPFKDLLLKTRDRRKWSRLVQEAINPGNEDG